jgi:3-dehydroquinate synthase
MELPPIVVQLGARSYSIHVGAGMLESLGARLRALGVGTRVALVTNPTVLRICGDRARESLAQAGFDVVTIEVPDGEEHKNLAWLAFVYDRLIEARVERGSALVALGGGVVGDLTGFAAATYLRGVPCIQAPTTLLAQVDASIGGKTAVNVAAGKNLIGAFHHPRMVLADTGLLEALPPPEYRSGLAEVVKYAVILAPELFDYLEDKAADVLARDPECLDYVVHTCAQLKALVVAEDETESDYRSVLNFGHTLGHAVEALSEYRGVRHGEAVAIGMAFAARLSIDRGMLDPAVGRRVVALLTRFDLPSEIPNDLTPAALALAVESDKKRAGGRVKFVCLEDLGRTRFEMLSTEELQRALETI